MPEGKGRAAGTNRRRWLSFSLRSLILLVLLCNAALSWIAHRRERAQEEKQAAGRLSELGAVIYYDAETLQSATGASRWPTLSLASWARKVLGDEFFDRVVGIELRNCNFAAEDLAAFETLQRLQWVDLSSTNVTDDCLVHLRKADQLTYVNLAYTEITDEGLKELAQMNTLTRLVLAGSQVTDAGIQHLKSSRALQQLDLSRTHTSPQARAELQSALPSCRLLDGPTGRRVPARRPANTK